MMKVLAKFDHRDKPTLKFEDTALTTLGQMTFDLADKCSNPILFSIQLFQYRSFARHFVGRARFFIGYW
jgi:hypothetical protein